MKDSAIDKIRAIAKWADATREGFNSRVRSISDWERLYNLAEKHGIEYLDEAEEYENGEKFMSETNAALGYKLYEV